MAYIFTCAPGHGPEVCFVEGSFPGGRTRASSFSLAILSFSVQVWIAGGDLRFERRRRKIKAAPSAQKMASFAPYCDPIVATPAAKDSVQDGRIVLVEGNISAGKSTRT